jgi:hypothetical protein
MLYPLLSQSQAFVEGTIMDNEKVVLPFSHVINITTGEVTLSGVTGYFNISAKEFDTLRISFVGYKTLILPVNSEMIGRGINIVLNPDYIELASVWVFSNQKYLVPQRYKGKAIKIPGISEPDPDYEAPKPGSFRFTDSDQALPHYDMPTIGLTLFGPFSYFSALEKEKRAALQAAFATQQTISFSRTMAMEQTRELFKTSFNLNDQELDDIIIKMNERLPEIQEMTQPEKIIEYVAIFISENTHH